MALKSVKVNDTISPVSSDEQTERQAKIVAANKDAKIRIMRVISKDAPESKKGLVSAISGKKGKHTFWVEYKRVTQDGKVEDGNGRFLSNHDLKTYFGCFIPEAGSTGSSAKLL